MEERICSVEDVAPGEARRFDLGSYCICVVRIDDSWYAIGDRCTHQDVSLSAGEVDVENLEIECWKHGSCFSLVDGESSFLLAIKAVLVWDVKIDGDDVYV